MNRCCYNTIIMLFLSGCTSYQVNIFTEPVIKADVYVDGRKITSLNDGYAYLEVKNRSIFSDPNIEIRQGKQFQRSFNLSYSGDVAMPESLGYVKKLKNGGGAFYDIIFKTPISNYKENYLLNKPVDNLNIGGIELGNIKVDVENKILHAGMPWIAKKGGYYMAKLDDNITCRLNVIYKKEKTYKILKSCGMYKGKNADFLNSFINKFGYFRVKKSSKLISEDKFITKSNIIFTDYALKNFKAQADNKQFSSPHLFVTVEGKFNIKVTEILQWNSNFPSMVINRDIKKELLKPESNSKIKKSNLVNLNILQVEITKEEQNFFVGFDSMSFDEIQKKMSSEKGYSYVKVTYSIKNPLKNKVEIDESKIIFVDGSGFIIGKGYGHHNDKMWANRTMKFIIKPNANKVFKKIFVVRDNLINNSKIIYNGNQYPLHKKYHIKRI